MLDAMIASALKRLLDKHIRIFANVSKSSVLRILTNSGVGDKLFAWSSSISVQSGLMNQYKDSQLYSPGVYRMTMSKKSTFDGIKLHCQRAKCLQV